MRSPKPGVTLETTINVNIKTFRYLESKRCRGSRKAVGSVPAGAFLCAVCMNSMHIRWIADSDLPSVIVPVCVCVCLCVCVVLAVYCWACLVIHRLWSRKWMDAGFMDHICFPPIDVKFYPWSQFEGSRVKCMKWFIFIWYIICLHFKNRKAPGHHLRPLPLLQLLFEIESSNNLWPAELFSSQGSFSWKMLKKAAVSNQSAVFG